jgi:probable phosphoglycerate mutase
MTTSPIHLYLARHGRTAWNQAGRFQGHTDIPLDEVGRAQATALVDLLRGQVDVAISSDLLRASESASIVASALGIPVLYVDADLRERGFGIFEGLTRDECIAKHPQEWAAREGNRNFQVRGGETPLQVVARMQRGLERAVEELRGQYTRALVVSHGSAMRMFLERFSHEPEPAFGNMEYRQLVHDGHSFSRK